MEVLYKSDDDAHYMSEFVKHNNVKYKISSFNGNCFSHVNISMISRNNDFYLIADERDISGCIFNDYTLSDTKQIKNHRENILLGEKFIESI